MSQVTKQEIVGAIENVTGAPSSGIVCDLTPGIAEAVYRLLYPKESAKETRIVKATETPEKAV